MLKNNVTFREISQIIQICTPLFSELEFCDFNYACVYSDGSRAHLGINERLMQYAFNEDSTVAINCQNIPWHTELTESQGIVLFSNLATNLQDYRQQKILKDHIYFEKQEFGHADTIILYKRQAHFIELLEFSCDEKFNLNDIYSHDFNQLLDHFYYYFKEKARYLIHESRENKILLARNLRKQFISIEGNVNSRYEEILQRTKVNRFYLENAQGDLQLYLTAKEMAVAKQLIRTPDIKSTAKYLNSSPRTVEKHIISLKDKLNCATKVTLVELLNNLIMN